MDQNSIGKISKIVLTCVLIILIIIQFDFQYVLPNYINIVDFFIIIISFLILLFIGLFIVYYGFSRNSLERMRNHEVVNGLLKSQFNVLYFSFLITMIMEELIFRYLIIKILKYFFLEEFVIVLISASIFSLYHIHIFFGFRKIPITIIYMSFSFVMAIFLGYIFFKLGVIFCIILHYVIALFIYFFLSRRIKKYSNKHFYFRELKDLDIPQINNISEHIWEGNDYVPYIIADWLNDKNSFNYGIFSDKEKTILIAFGRIKFLSNSHFWLEGGRVHEDFQGKGIGTKMMEFSLKYCKEKNVRKVQYDTASTNEASIALAKKFGFHKKLSMYVLETSSKLNSVTNTNISDHKLVEILDPEKAISKYREILPEEQSEICIGWSYIPLKLNYMRNNKWRWISLNDGILHEISKERNNILEGKEKSETWLITYGNTNAIEKLVKIAVDDAKYSENVDELSIFCEEKHLSRVKKLGFKFWEDIPVKVVLFEKNLSYY